MIDPGQLNRRLVLEEPVETPDGQGGVARSYAAVATLWASLTPLRARSALVADANGAVATHRIVIRDNFEVSLRHRFRKGDDVFRILTIEQDDDALLAIETEIRRD